MIPARLPSDEPARLAALGALGLSEGVREERFDRLTRLAATALGVPIALIGLVDAERQWFKSRHGLDVAEVPRDQSFCAHAIVDDACADGSTLFVVEDAAADERFADHPLVTGAPHIRAYAGQVLRSADGLPMGTLCVMSDRARVFDDADRRALADLATLVEVELGRRATEDLLAELHAARRSAEVVGERLRLAAEASGVGTALIDGDGALLFANAAFARIVGREPDTLVGCDLDDLVTSTDHEAVTEQVAQLRSRTRSRVEYEGSICGSGRWARTHRALLETTDGSLAELVQVEDITERRDLELELRRSETSARASLDALDQGVLLCDTTGAIARINPAAERLLGYTAEEITPLWRSGEWVTYDEHGDVMPYELRPVMRAIATGEPARAEIVGWRRKDGERILLRLSCVPLGDDVGGMVIAFTDITDEHRSRQLLDATLETAPVGLAVLSIDRTILRCNSMFVAHSGRTATELIGVDIATLLSEEDDRREALSRTAEILAKKELGGETRRNERRIVRPDGSERWFTTELAIIADPDLPRGIIATFDVTEQRKMNLELSRFEYLFRHANDIITVVDASGRVLYASPSNGRVLGYGDDWNDPRGILGLVHPDDTAKAEAEFAALVRGDRGGEPFTLRVRSASGEWRHLECVGVNLLDEPAVGGIVLTSRDTTERERLTSQLAHSATHDDLTDLANRNLLESQLSGALARALRDDHQVGLCFIDLDGFKHVNDSFGHAVGDQLLVEVAHRIRGAIRGGDLAARIGGDEFVVMIDPVAGATEALAAATRIRDALVADLSFIANGLSCGASIGVAVSAIDDTPSSLLRRADGALYRAKALRQSAIEVAVDVDVESAVDSAVDSGVGRVR